MSDFRWQVADKFEGCRAECSGYDLDPPISPYPARNHMQCPRRWVYNPHDAECPVCGRRGYVPADDPEMGWALLEWLQSQGREIAYGYTPDVPKPYWVEADEATISEGAIALEALAYAALALKEGP